MPSCSSCSTLVEAAPVAIAAVLALCFTQLPLWVGQSPPAGERFTVLTACSAAPTSTNLPMW